VRTEYIRKNARFFDMRTIFASILFFALTPLASMAEVRNSQDFFKDRYSCQDYDNFLAGEEPVNPSHCHLISNFIMKNYSMGLYEFLQKFESTVNRNSGLNYLINGQIGVIRSNASRSYMWLDVADRQLFSDMMQSGDKERAVFYSGLMSAVKADAIKSFCDGENPDCENISGNLSIEEIVSELPSDVVEARPDVVLMCLLRTDAYITPLRSVLFSKRFQSCINNKGVF